MQPIVVGVDGSSTSDSALAWAVAAAPHRGGAIRAVHAWHIIVPGDFYGGVGIVSPSVFEEAGRSILDDSVTRASAAGTVPIERVLVPGNASAALIDAAKDADLLVVGSRGRGGFAGLLLGSVSQQVARHAPCPVVVVPSKWRQEAKHGILVGVDGSEGGRLALSWALDHAMRTGAEVDVVLCYGFTYAWMDVGADYQEAWAHEATEKANAELRRMLDERAAEAARVTIFPTAIEGEPTGVLLDRARSADLLVVGSRGRGGFAGLLLGSVSQRCIEHASCPVVVVRAPT